MRAKHSKTQPAPDLRELDRMLFDQITSSLVAANDPGSRAETASRTAVLGRNSALWEALRADLMRPETGLPASLRAQLMNLSRWVERETASVLEGRSDLGQLIAVNRAMLDGLAP